MKKNINAYLVTTENGREEIQVTTREEADRAKVDLERRHGRIVLILPINRPLVGGVL